MKYIYLVKNERGTKEIYTSLATACEAVEALAESYREAAWADRLPFSFFKTVDFEDVEAVEEIFNANCRRVDQIHSKYWD